MSNYKIKMHKLLLHVKIQNCLPSPACMERLGTIIRGRQVVDPFGENVQSTITTGDHYRKRHDAFKMRLFQMCLWAGLDAEVEIFIPDNCR